MKVVDFVKTPKSFFMVQELANGGSLKSLLDLRGPFKESIAKKMLKQIIKGCTDLYRDMIVHRDMKLDNILIFFPKLSS